MIWIFLTAVLVLAVNHEGFRKLLLKLLLWGGGIAALFLGLELLFLTG